MNIICNAFSLQMVAPEDWGKITVEAIETPSAKTLAQAQSAIGHADTAAVLGVPMNRTSIALKGGDTLLVAQLIGGRLPEGCTTLPDGFAFKWAKVTLKDAQG